MPTPRQDFFTRNPQKNGFSGGTIRTPKTESKTSLWWIVLPIVLIVSGISAYFFWEESINEFIRPEEQAATTGYAIASSIQQEGVLKEESSDLIAYTHTLTNASGEVFLLKSRKISLSNYAMTLTGVIQVIGTVESYYQGKPLIEVETVGSNTAGALEENTPLANTSTDLGMYLAKAGLYFGPEFFDLYTFVGQAGAEGKITVQNMENTKTTTISFFNCGNSNDTNCQQLATTFKSSATNISTNAHGDTFYRLEDNTRFFQNNNWRGYFIHEADAQEVEKLKNLITIASPSVIASAVSQHGVKTCLGSDNGLNRITSHSAKKTASGLEITMIGTGEKSFTCTAMLDLAKSTKLAFLDIKTENLPAQKPVENSEIKQPEPTANATTTKTVTFDPNVAQFPISTEKTFTYTSNRGGYSITLPSMNIAYEGFTPTATPENAKCTYALRVVQHKNKDVLATQPALNIYECKKSQNLISLGENFIIKELGDKTFILEVLDGAWVNFANAVSIQTLSA